MARRGREVRNLYYITHIGNLPSILKLGILSHKLIEDQGIPFTPIYASEIVSRRQGIHTPQGNSLWEFANLYFQPRNPMLYRVINEKGAKDLAILAVQPSVLDIPGAHISTGNAAADLSELMPATEGLKIIIEELWEVVNSDWWREDDGSKRKIMAECLVPDKIGPESIHSIYVTSHKAAEDVRALLPPHCAVPVIQEPHMFFQPRRRDTITERLSWVDGDMFFSQMQTLTISVNTVGVMGKGLASRAKYQFPDVYVYYQDVCRRKSLQMGKPVLYQRETSVDRELADDPFSLPNINANKWFLLFPTKRHWKDQSDVNGIKEGLQWLRANYKTSGITTLAVPALGCGLGGLDWHDIGPLLCRHLADLDITAVIYLPQEQEIASEFLSREFLLSQKNI